MDGRLSEVQLMLKESLDRLLAAQAGPGERKEPASGRPSALWRTFADDLGLLAAPFDEEAGGLGGGAGDIRVIMEAFGRRLVREPYVSTVVIAGLLLAEAGCEDEAAAIRAGGMTVAIAYLEPQGSFDPQDVETRAVRDAGGWRLTGRKVVVRDGPGASHLLISARTSGETRAADGITLFLVPASACAEGRQTYGLVDGAAAFDVDLDLTVADAARVGDVGNGMNLLGPALDRGVVALCAEAVGLMRAMLDQTVSYTRQREQFGRPLSAFQVLQHRMVDMLIEVEQSESITLRAAASPGDARAAAAAKARVGKALRFVSQSAVHLHGGIGTTAELDLAHYFRRAMALEVELGSADHHLRRYERLGRAAA
jgi:alkylation response protein AidB-like acyl-CoA dehydrogenase